MSDSALKLEVLKHVMPSENDAKLVEVLSILRKESADFWDELTTAQKAEVELSRQQIAENKVEDWQAVYKRLSK